MEGSPGEGLIRDVAGARVVDMADRHVVARDLEGRARLCEEPTSAGFDVRCVDHPPGVVLTLDGELDLATAPVLQERLGRATRGGAAVVIDLSGLRFMDSSGLEVLVGAERELRGSGGQLVLVRGPRVVHQVFELMGLDSHFEFCDSPSVALRTAIERRIGSRETPEPGANRQPAAELARELGGMRW